ncbi:MAG: GNAT family N-acetyltransferase [Humibacillus sp.]|nr:GNAT family N-acetyltransferase [Humibacillus sp.]MDN5775525.1 GNAT family N-acetyltransferase [Humibacillus sp.]
MPPRSLTFTSTTDPLEAKAWFAGLIEREPAALSVIASVVDSLVVDPERFADPRWWAGREGGPDGTVVAAVMHTLTRPVYIGWATPEAARQLAEQLAREQHVAGGVGGDREAALAFADTWVAERGGRAVTTMELGAFDLPAEATLPFEVAGNARPAEPDDVDLVDGWMRSFQLEVEAGHVDPPAVPPPGLEPAVRDGRVLLWVNDHRAVSMAYTSVPNGGVVRISGVWTPPEHRRHGYASAVVADLSRLQSEAGYRCLLFTDLANPTSNAIYQAIGYRRIGDQVTIDFG